MTKTRQKWLVQFVLPWMTMGVDDTTEPHRLRIAPRYTKHAAIAVARLYHREFNEGCKARAFCPKTGEYYGFVHEDGEVKEYNGRENVRRSRNKRTK